MEIYKRNGTKAIYDVDKIITAIKKAYQAEEEEFTETTRNTIASIFSEKAMLNLCVEKLGRMIPSVEDIQEEVEYFLMKYNPKVAKAYIKYRYKQSRNRFIKDKIKYITGYAKSTGNAASCSNTDANANNSIKNVASIEPEVFKNDIREIQRQMMKDKITELYSSELAEQYLKDIEDKIIYPNDESNSPIQKAYCGAYSTYPLITKGCGGLDGVTPSEPNDIWSYSGQVTNAVFALSAQTKGAVALGDYLISFNYMVVKEFGPKWYDKLDVVICNDHVLNSSERTIKREIRKGMKHYIWGVNQPQGNRGFQSPFTNLNFFDKYYYQAMFGEFYYPDGTQPEWKAIDTLQRLFLEVLRDVREVVPVTFPVTTIALLSDENGFKDEEYAKLCAEEWSKGSSHFLYQSNNPDSLSSCCRVQNKIDKNYFTSTTGMIGLMTGSCNVITLNINRIIQNYYKELPTMFTSYRGVSKEERQGRFKDYLTTILNRVYKYHIAYKTMLYDLEELGMITYSKADYLYIKKLYSTIGVLGYYEAAKYLGLSEETQEYIDFQSFLLNTISENNKINSIQDKKRPFIFNLECVPGENMAVKFYNWDKEDGYFVPEDQILYNSYFFNPWTEPNPLAKIKLHGGDISKASDGGQGCHINLDEHPSPAQCFILMDAARKEGCNYMTLNVPFTRCLDCGHIHKTPVSKCPKCGSKHLDFHTKVIGFITPVSNWSPARQLEFLTRLFGEKTANEIINNQ